MRYAVASHTVLGFNEECYDAFNDMLKAEASEIRYKGADLTVYEQHSLKDVRSGTHEGC